MNSSQTLTNNYSHDGYMTFVYANMKLMRTMGTILPSVHTDCSHQRQWQVYMHSMGRTDTIIECASLAIMETLEVDMLVPYGFLNLSCYHYTVQCLLQKNAIQIQKPHPGNRINLQYYYCQSPPAQHNLHLPIGKYFLSWQDLKNTL